MKFKFFTIPFLYYPILTKCCLSRMHLLICLFEMILLYIVSWVCSSWIPVLNRVFSLKLWLFMIWQIVGASSLLHCLLIYRYGIHIHGLFEIFFISTFSTFETQLGLMLNTYQTFNSVCYHKYQFWTWDTNFICQILLVKNHSLSQGIKAFFFSQYQLYWIMNCCISQIPRTRNMSKKTEFTKYAVHISFYSVDLITSRNINQSRAKLFQSTDILNQKAIENGKLMHTEEIEEGVVSVSTYILYARAAGGRYLYFAVKPWNSGDMAILRLQSC